MATREEEVVDGWGKGVVEKCLPYPHVFPRRREFEAKIEHPQILVRINKKEREREEGEKGKEKRDRENERET